MLNEVAINFQVVCRHVDTPLTLHSNNSEPTRTDNKAEAGHARTVPETNLKSGGARIIAEFPLVPSSRDPR